MSAPLEEQAPIPSRPTKSTPNMNMYATATQYVPQTQYYSTPHINRGEAHVVSPPTRAEAPPQRKRPKYTRSKTGCMTCRVKKVKCDETKPKCMRCTHGQRDCTWPEGVPTRKRSSASRDSDDRPSTAGSPGLSEESTPSTRDHTPPSRAPVDLGLPPLASRRQADPYHVHQMSSEPDLRRHHERGGVVGYSQHPVSNANALSMIPEISTYPSQPRYEHYSSSGTHNSPLLSHPSSASRHTISANSRHMMGGGHQSVHHWNSSPVVAPEPYYHDVQERMQQHPSDAHHRYHQ